MDEPVSDSGRWLIPTQEGPSWCLESSRVPYLPAALKGRHSPGGQLCTQANLTLTGLGAELWVTGSEQELVQLGVPWLRH